MSPRRFDPCVGKLTSTPSLRIVETSFGSDGLGPWTW